jgi:hypothetical protein
MNSYEDLLTGAIGILCDVTSILNRKETNYIIVGGWSPFLLNSQPYHHPGTKDVDILFDKAYNKDSLREIILALLEEGFILSAKHDFQLFREVDIKGNRFIYNVDLLHPLETANPNEIYVEHIDLDIPASQYQQNSFIMKSIALPSSQILFDAGLFTKYQLNLEMNGEAKTIHQTFPLMNEIGTLITKSKSVLIEKRYRDSLDIYLAIKQNRNYEKMIEKILFLKENHRTAYNTLYGIRKAYESRVLITNVDRFFKVDRTDFISLFEKFLSDTLLIDEAANIEDNE